MRHTLYHFSILITIVLSGVSCKKFIEIDPPINQLTTETVFTDSTTANATVAGLYSTLFPGSTLRPLNGLTTLFAGLSADEINQPATTNVNYPAFTANAIPATNDANNDFWTYFYRAVYHANLVNENIGNSEILSVSLKQRLTGEVLFIRGMLYFYLTNFYGQVPVALTSDYNVNAALARVDTAMVYDQIIADLKQAKTLLTTNYTTDGNLRANRWTATALLARVYLYQRDWANAEKEATEVINSGIFQLGTITNTFLAASPETIQQFSSPIAVSVNCIDGSNFIPTTSASSRPSFTILDTLYNSFEAGDLRKTNWITSKTVSGVVYRYPYKYKVRTGTAGSPKTEHNIALRLAEQYLIRAEALAWQGNLAAAIKDLDIIRKRAGLLLIADTKPDISFPDLLTVIYHERQTELFTEWGHRWFDLKRTGRINSVLANIKSGWKPTAALFPVPSSQIRRSPYLTQNPGY